MAGLISEEDGLFKVTFPFSGEQHEVHSLQSLAEAGLVGMALAVRAAEELQRALDATVPGNEGQQPSFRLPQAASPDASRLRPASFSQLVEQLQACMDWRDAELAQYAAQYGEEEEEAGEGMASVSGLLAAAASLGFAGVTHFLALLSPAAASAEWLGEGEGSAAHRAAKQGHAEALRALLVAVPGAALARSSGYEDRRGWQHKDWSMLHSAAEGGSLEAVQVLLEAAPQAAAAVTNHNIAPLHVAAEAGHAPVVQALLQAAPEAALVADEDGELPLHWGARHAEVVQLLLAAAPATAFARTADGSTALHFAASEGARASAQALLQAAPEAALMADDSGKLPLRLGARNLELVQLLLAAAPGTALARTAHGSTALHIAASEGACASAQALLQAAPEAALMADDSGKLPLHLGARNLELVQLLLAAAPGTALACTADGSTALHAAVSEEAPASAKALLQAAPEAAGIADAYRRTPLQHGLACPNEWFRNEQYLEILCVLVAADISPATLSAIAERGRPAAALFADFIAAAPPLTAEQWACVPALCPRLGRALPGALAHSHEQARQLVSRLPLADATRLRTFALALADMQRRLRVVLPGDVAGKLLSLCLAD